MLAQIAGRMAHLGAWVADLHSERCYWSDEVCDIHEVPHGTWPTFKQAYSFYPPHWRAQVAHAVEACSRDATPFDMEVQMQTGGGKLLWVRTIGEAVRDDAGVIVQLQGAFQNIGAAKQAEEQRTQLAGRLTATLETITDAFVMINRDWTFGYLNREAERLLQCRREDVLGKDIWTVHPLIVGTRYETEYRRAMKEGVAVAFEEYYAPVNLWSEVRAFPSEEGLAVYFVDIQARKAAESQIRSLAYFDTLTGLPNRSLLVERLDAALAPDPSNPACSAVLIIDLDNFKSINDTRGHDKGDMLLKLVTARLTDSVRRADLVARFGGDEFIILLGALGDDPVEAARRAEKTAHTILATFAEAFEIEGLPQYSSASIGVALFGHNHEGDPLTPDDVLRRADLAMYHAKAAGRNAVALYDPGMQARALHRAGLEADLRNALAQSQFLLHYQPLAAVDGSMTGVEALARWQHPQRGMISPAEFIPAAEDSGLILALGDWVLHTACTLLAQSGQQARSGHLTMSVNVSAHQFHRPDFVAGVKGALAATGANPRRLKLELTESLMIKDLEGTISKMLALRQIGVGFSLDDFGTGYSSLAHLHRLPLDELKIDQSFVRDAVSGGHGALIVHTILALGKALNLSVLAEGVETAEQYEFVQWAGCHAYQGYLYSRPLSAAALEGFITHAAIVPTGMNGE